MLLTFRERRMADSRLKELTQRVIDTQEEERARLARELHDGVSQNLLGVRYVMDLASRKVRNQVDDAATTIEKGWMPSIALSRTSGGFRMIFAPRAR